MTEPSSAPTSTPEPIPSSGPLDSVLPPAVLPLMRLLPTPPEGAILVPPEPHDAPRRTWFLIEMWLEIRLAVKMYFDPRYRVSRTAQIAFPLFAGLLVLNYFLFSVWFSIMILSPVVERVLDVIVAVLAYRVLTRELLPSRLTPAVRQNPVEPPASAGWVR